MMKKISGFSVLEMLITLMVTCSLILLGSLELKAYQQNLIFADTVKQVMLALEQGSKVSTINQSRISVTYLPRSHRLVMLGKDFKRNIAIDHSIDIDNLTDFDISAKGMINPRTITFRDQYQTKKVNIQMAWGRVTDD